MSKIEELARNVEMGKSKLVPGLVQECLDEGNAPLDILNKGMIDAMAVVGVSALLTTTMPAMQETVAALNAMPWRKDFKIMVGGAPITQSFADEIGADIYTEDAASAGQAAKRLAMQRMS